MSDPTRGPDDDFTPWTPDAATEGVASDNVAPGAGDPSPLVADVGEATATVAAIAGATGAGPDVATPGSTSPGAAAVFIDSSAIVALVDQDDASHEDAVSAYRGLVGAGYRLFTTNYVVAETYDLLRTGVGHAVARQWLRDSALATYHADEQDERRARRVVLRARGARGLTMTDAISLVVMERFGVADAFAVDPDFLAGGE